MVHPRLVRKQRHIVVAVAVITDPAGRFLVCRRNDPRNPKFHNKLEFPGGSVEIFETPEQALKREIKEEIDCEIEIHRLIPHVVVSNVDGARRGLNIFVLFFHATITQGTPQPCSSETLECLWLTEEAINNQATLPGVAQVIALFRTTAKK